MEYKKSHPYFQLPFINELYRGKISEIDENNKKTEQDLIITNVGFFFLRKRTFPSGFICSNAISPEFISIITLGDEKLTLLLNSDSESSNKEQKKTFISKDVIKILSIMIQVRSALFGSITVKSESESLKDELKSNVFTYSSRNLNSERFLSHAINSSPSDILNLAPKIYDMFTKGNFSFMITQDILKSSLKGALTQTLMEIQYFYELIISNGEYSFFLDFLSQVIQKSSYLTKIIFDKVSFTKLIANNLIFHQNNHQTSFNSISFINGCDFSTNQFLIFLKDISNYQGNIESIIINNCIFTENTLSSFFDHLNGVKSIKNIKYFEIDEIPIRNQLQEPLTRLLNSQNHIFQCIRVSDPSLNAESLLSNSTLYDIKLEEVHFQKCSFLKKINPIENFFSINTLDFSQTKFTFESLKSLFDVIKLPIRKIILNNIDIENQNLAKFYDQLSHYNLSFLEQFEFADNFVPSSYISHFFDFVSKMKNLTILDISSSLDPNYQSIIDKISNLLHSLPNLLFLIFKGSNKSTFGSEFTQILDNLPPYLLYLDISNQNIGDDGMQNLSQFIISRSQPNNQLTNTFSFTATTIGHPFLTNFVLEADGFLKYIKCESMGCTIKGLIPVIEAIVNENSTIKKAEWNQKEISKLLKKASSSEKSKFDTKIKQLKESFDKKFLSNDENSPLSISSVSPHSFIRFSVNKPTNSDSDQENETKEKVEINDLNEEKENNNKKKYDIDENNEAKSEEKEEKKMKEKIKDKINGDEDEKEKNEEKIKEKTNTKRKLEETKTNEDNKNLNYDDNNNDIEEEKQKETDILEETEQQQIEKQEDFDESEKQQEIEKQKVIKEIKSIPPLVIKPTTNYREILLNNDIQEFKDQLIECVGEESASKNPLEEALSRLEKEAPFLIIESSTS